MSYNLWSPMYTQLPCDPVQTNNRYVLTEMWKKYLIERAMSVYKWDVPELWSENYFKYLLYGIGFVSVVYTARYGWIPQRCGLFGQNPFEEPDSIQITNTFVSGIQRKIGNGCVLFTMNDDYTGVGDIIAYYAMQLAEMSLTAYANMQNSKVSYILSAENKNQAEDMKKMADQVMNGEVAVIMKKTAVGTWETFSQNVKQNYIVNELFTDMRKVMDQFDTFFGIQNANTEKRERLVTDEVNSNNVETETLAGKWLESWKSTCDQLNRIAGEKLMGVDWSDAVKRGGIGQNVQAGGNEPVKRDADSGGDV